MLSNLPKIAQLISGEASDYWTQKLLTTVPPVVFYFFVFLRYGLTEGRIMVFSDYILICVQHENHSVNYLHCQKHYLNVLGQFVLICVKRNK